MAGSAASARTAVRPMIPPTSALRSRPPRPDHVRHADAGAVEQRGRLLRAGARRRDDGHRPGALGEGRDDVGEAQAGPAQHRGAGARAHDEQAQLLGPGLELDLGGDGDVVAEQQDVQARAQRLVRLQGGVVARAPRSPRRCRRRGARAPRPAVRAGASAASAPVSAARAENIASRPASSAASTASSRRRPHREHEVARAGARPGRRRRSPRARASPGSPASPSPRSPSRRPRRRASPGCRRAGRRSPGRCP